MRGRLIIGQPDISVFEVFSLLKTGTAVYIASAPVPAEGMRLRGAWQDESGNTHFDYSGVFLSKEAALSVARAHNQQCILALMPSPYARGKVYLIQDTIANRTLALQKAGGYTADGEWLFTAVPEDHSPFTDDYTECLPVIVEFLPVQ
jgi:hypothetical protein